MKKFGIIALTVFMVLAFTVPAMAELEHQFGGYWRTRAFQNKYFSGQDNSADLSKTDTRTRLYYTAILNENLKLVNKFEMDATFGDSVRGDIGADGQNFEIKNTYADFNLGPVNAKIGTHAGTLSRGFIFDDDFTGATIAYQGQALTFPFIWIKAYDGGQTATDLGSNDYDVDYYAISPVINAWDKVSINPMVVYATAVNASGFNAAIDDLGLWYIGVNVDLNFEKASAWVTLIDEFGNVDVIGTNKTQLAAFLMALGGSFDFGKADMHGQFVFATGDDPADTGETTTAFWVPRGQSYYWAEIMGYGMFDDQVSNNSPADQIGNVMFLNIGSDIKPMDKLKISVDLWYATLVQDMAVLNTTTNTTEDVKDLGIEIDVKVSYQLIENLNLDVVAAYLMAGDATTKNATITGLEEEENPYEVGTQLSLSF